MKAIRLSCGKTVAVDDDDYEFISQYRWFRSVGKYAAATIGGKRVYMHRVIMGNPAGKEIDHINGDGLDNRKQNLRICEHRENLRAMKMKVRKTSRYRGVYLDRSRNHQTRK